VGLREGIRTVARARITALTCGKADIDDAVMPAPGGFSVLLAGSGMVEYSRLTSDVRVQLLDVIEKVAPRFDHILLDTGAGISDVVLYTVSLADDVLVVTTTDLTSLTDARRPMR
jgi:flagellar biosynthesis protein FlhG